MEEALAQRVRPLNLEGMDSDQLKERMHEYWKAFTSIKKEKASLEARSEPVIPLMDQLVPRFEEQNHEIKAAQEALAEIVLAKQAKKGIDMERLALGPGGGLHKCFQLNVHHSGGASL